MRKVERIGQAILDVLRDRKAKYLTVSELYAIPAAKDGGDHPEKFGDIIVRGISPLKAAAVRYLLKQKDENGKRVLLGVTYSPERRDMGASNTSAFRSGS